MIKISNNDNKLAHINDHDAQVLGMWVQTKKRKSINTASVYHGVAKEFFKFMNYKPMNSISYGDLVEYSQYLSNPNPRRNPATLKISTQNRKIATIKSLFKYAMKIGYIKFNPAEPLETQRVDRKTAQRILSDDEILLLLNTASKTSILHLLVIYFLACTGCRESELANLMWKDFFYGAAGEICVNITGKGHKDRNLKINSGLWKVILAYRKEIGLSVHINPKDKSPFLINRYGNNRSRQSVWTIVKEVVKASGLDKNASPHWIRHSFATSVASDETANIWRLQNDLGHASIVTTQDYVHIAQSMKETSIDHLGYRSKIEAALENIVNKNNDQ